MEEKKIEYKTAVLAKEVGFDWLCNSLYYTSDGEIVTTEMNHIQSEYKDREWYSRPRQGHLQMWLRKEYQLQVNTFPVNTHHLSRRL